MATLTASVPVGVPAPVPQAGIRTRAEDGRARKVVVVLLVTFSAGAHMVSALASTGAMAWMMAGMGLACGSCLVHLWRGSCAVRTATRHLLAMCAAMALFHMAWLTFPSAAGSHQHGSGAAADSAVAQGDAGHGALMLGVIGVELLCMAGAAVLLRVGSGDRRRPDRTPPADRLPAAPTQEN